MFGLVEEGKGGEMQGDGGAAARNSGAEEEAQPEAHEGAESGESQDDKGGLGGGGWGEECRGAANAASVRRRDFDRLHRVSDCPASPFHPSPPSPPPSPFAVTLAPPKTA